MAVVVVAVMDVEAAQHPAKTIAIVVVKVVRMLVQEVVAMHAIKLNIIKVGSNNGLVADYQNPLFTIKEYS